MPYNYSFSAYFISSRFDIALLTSVVPIAESIFNALPRKAGHKKYIHVSVNKPNRCLDIELGSDLPLDPINYLRAAQYFSKVLSMQPSMVGYTVDGRLLVK